MSSRAITAALERRHTLLEGQQINQWLKEEVAHRVAERRVEQASQERLSVATLGVVIVRMAISPPAVSAPAQSVAKYIEPR